MLHANCAVVRDMAAVYKPPRAGEVLGFACKRKESRVGVARDAWPEDKNLPAFRQRAVHERAPARLFPRQAARPGRKTSSKEAKETLQHLQDENQNHPDLADRASSETDRAIELRARDRQRKLIAKIDAALAPDRRRHLRLLRGDRRADRAAPPRSAPDRDAVDRGAGAPRAPRAGLSRRLRPGRAVRGRARPAR